MKINIVFSKNTQDYDLESVLTNVLRQVRGEGYDNIVVPTLSEEQKDELLDKLNSMKEVFKASYGTVSHSFGMGGVFGTGITVHIRESERPTILWDKGEGTYLVNTAHFLSQFDVSEQDQRIIDEVFNGDGPDYIEHLESMTDIEYTSDNSYNSSSDLSQDIVFHFPKDWESLDTILVVLAIHQGGDVRGNYGPYLAYKMGYDSFCTFLTQHFGFHSVDDSCDGYYEASYTSEPQYAFYKDYDFVELVDERTIKAKNKTTGEVKEFSADVLF